MTSAAVSSSNGKSCLAVMRHRTAVRAVVGGLVFALAIAYGVPAVADIAPLWSDGELVRYSRVVLTGEVTRVTSRWDDAVDGIYTYVTVRVEEVLKGNVPRRRITLKQLGGHARGQTLRVAGQPTFNVGERVLLFLELRPRDNTLYTTAHWQGKWRIERDSDTGAQRALRTVPGDTAQLRIDDPETRPLAGFLRTLRARAGAEAENKGAAPVIRFTPPELSEGNSDPIDYDPLDYTLFGPGFWPVFPDLDIHAAGQGGLAGGGFNELGAARGAINAAGSALSIGAGANNVAAGCFVYSCFSSCVRATTPCTRQPTGKANGASSGIATPEHSVPCARFRETRRSYELTTQRRAPWRGFCER